MRDFSSVLLSQQNQSTSGQEGIPYWTFWLLLCVILLLVAFIFLRDKSLRQKINSFLFGVKKQLNKRRLRARLKRVKKKREDIFKELGQKAAEEEIQPSNCTKTNLELSALEEKKELLKKELKDIQSEISLLKQSFEEFTGKHESFMRKHAAEKRSQEEKLSITMKIQKQLESDVIEKQKELERTTLEMNTAKKGLQEKELSSKKPTEEYKRRADELKKQIKDFEEKKADVDQKINSLIEKNEKIEKERKKYEAEIDAQNKEMKKHKEEIKKPSRDYQKEILEWEKSQDKIQDKIHRLEMMKEPLFKTLGEKIDRERLEHKEFIIFYSQIDRKNKRIEEIEKQIIDLG